MSTFRLVQCHGSQYQCGSNDFGLVCSERMKKKPEEGHWLKAVSVRYKGQPPPGLRGRLSPGSPGETHSSRRCCSDPWAWWPARRCGGHTQPLSFRTAQTRTRGCSRGTLWTAAFYGSRWPLSRNWPEETNTAKHWLQVLKHNPKPLTGIIPLWYFSNYNCYNIRKEAE